MESFIFCLVYFWFELLTCNGFCTRDGKTRPGESHSFTVLVRKMVWKCFVWPGVRDVLTTFLPTKPFIKEDFPTLGYPGKRDRRT
jgi:hypothetical protein